MTLPPYSLLVRWYKRAIWEDFPSMGHAPEAAAAMHYPPRWQWDNIKAHNHGGGEDGITGAAASYVYDSPFQLDEQGYYVTPLKAALATIPDTFMVRYLRHLPGTGYDAWQAADDLGNLLVMAVAEQYATRALAILRMRYREHPYASSLP